jgi:hypothetical protein
MPDAFPFRAVRTRSHDEFRRRADECRRLAAAARNAGDKSFWLGLVARWQVLENIREPAPTLSLPLAGKERMGAAARNAKAVRSVHGR